MIFMSMRESAVEDGTPPEGRLPVQQYHSACYRLLLGADDVAKCLEEVITCCEWVFSQEELLVLLKDLGIRSWLLWVQSIFSPQENECGRVCVVQEQTATKPKLR